MPVSMCVRVRMRACVRVFLCVSVKPKTAVDVSAWVACWRGVSAALPLRHRLLPAAAKKPPPKSRRPLAPGTYMPISFPCPEARL